MRSLSCAGVCVALIACGDDGGSGGESGSTSPASSTSETVSSGGTGGGGAAPVCGTAEGELPSGLETITWDDGVVETNLRNENFQINVDGDDILLNEEPIHEAVRFDLEHPARVHGFSIHWGAIPEGSVPTTELEAGLYGDFGHNGFDFWAPEPLWSGTRCVEHADADGWTTYVFDTPVEIDQPGLVYVAHLGAPGSAVFDFDGSVIGEGNCAAWDDCHSALNLPESHTSTYYNGVSFPFQYDYLVRLHVEYTDSLAPEERLFQPRDFMPASRVSFGDYDNDGWDDILTDGPKLWRNQGDGTFVDATATSGITALGIAATGGVFGDYDNDGCVDMFLYAEAYSLPDVLLHSLCDGTFEDVTAAAQIVDNQTYEDCNMPGVNTRSPTAAAAWIDIDSDGLLDLYLANFICWEKGTSYTDGVWHNLGDGTFEDWTAQNGFLPTEKLAGRGASPIDSDLDGDVDLFVNDYRLHRNLFYENIGGGLVQEVAQNIGVAGEVTQGYYGHTIGGAWGDLDNDGDFDLISANLAHPRFFDFSDKTEVLIQDAGTFTDVQGDWAIPESLTGLRYQETHSVPVLADFDADGNLDLVITAVYPGRPTDFYWGNGDATFVLDAYHAGITTEDGWGVAASDIDHDGDLDLFARQPFVNEIAGGHWLQVRAVGNVVSNRMAIGATVFVTTGGTTRMRHVQGGTGQGNQDSQYLHFGLADATSVDQIRVVYPGGGEVTYDGPFDADQRVWVYEDGTTALGWVAPN